MSPLFRQIRHTFAVVAAAMLVPAAVDAQHSAAPPPYRLSLRAQLFYNDKGTFSPDLIAHPVELWNTPAGEGRAGGSSNAVLVTAVVTGEAGTYLPERTVELTVTAGGHEFFQRAEETGIIMRDGHSYVAFWLYRTGCQRLRLSARIAGQSASTPVVRTIPFACGE